jgi:hypothetical protein
VTGAVFPAGYSTGNGHYEEEMGDLDKDGDLDIYGLNWQAGFGFNDITMHNNGSGVYGNLAVLSGSSADDNEGDFLDYDNDGDMDLFVANFSGQDKLYRNDMTVPGSFSYTKVTLPTDNSTSLDADTADTDGDGDYDVIVANDGTQNEAFLKNTTQVPDTHAPYLPNIEALGNQTAAAAGDPVRVHVYDNASYYTTWYNPTVLNVSVNGINLPALDAVSSAGQVFRGVVPGNLVGAVGYRFTSSDEYGNTGSSSTVNYTGSYGPAFATSYSTGTSGLTGGEPQFAALSVPFSNSTMYLSVSSGAAPGTTALIGIGTVQIPTGLAIPGLLFLNIAGTPLLNASTSLDANGDAVVAVPIPTVPSGVHVYGQGFVLDPTGGGHLFASSKGLDIVTQ